MNCLMAAASSLILEEGASGLTFTPYDSPNALTIMSRACFPTAGWIRIDSIGRVAPTLRSKV